MTTRNKSVRRASKYVLRIIAHMLCVDTAGAWFNGNLPSNGQLGKTKKIFFLHQLLQQNNKLTWNVTCFWQQADGIHFNIYKCFGYTFIKKYWICGRNRVHWYELNFFYTMDAAPVSIACFGSVDLSNLHTFATFSYWDGIVILKCSRWKSTWLKQILCIM